ncbi:hypothetical protein GCM10008959_24570 [Deinococcus seoulensis]|uniref:DUF3809 domain-containing protein n=1 Tax=Deinococcus seoulensis TaxID=1837379 RepID=A0ABQ2RS51_9DEIO|nr:DUF3809 domain-containing protein [Deinococcus seoulensis]GGR61688.1 hypothetical protein GCM10008959_24570 [Deinococcus seoulensis]
MIFDAEQTFTLTFPGDRDAALAFVRDPARALGRLRFLRDLRAGEGGVRGELVVPLPGLGDADLPFHSLLSLTQDGADLIPQALSGERAWVEVAGQARVQDAGPQPELHFAFQFRAHLATPDAQGWGGAAFEKMIRAAASRTLDRVARELPGSIQAALPGPPA